MKNEVYRDLLSQYNNLNEDEARALLIYKSQMFNLINSVSSIDDFNDLSDEFIVKCLDNNIFLECRKFGLNLEKPENMFLKFSTFRNIDFNNPISLVKMAKDVYNNLESAMSKIKLSSDLTVYRLVSLPDNKALDNIAKGNLVSTSINKDSTFDFINNSSNRIVMYEIRLKSGTPVLVTPYSIVNNYASEIDKLLKTDNYNITVNKTLESFQQEVILFKDTLNFSLVDSKSTDIDGTSITFYKLDSTVKDNYKVK